jgi:hypothetical protein
MSATPVRADKNDPQRHRAAFFERSAGTLNEEHHEGND